jgi:hypothetical protein
MHIPAKVAYVIPADKLFITCDNENIQKIIVMALNDAGNIFENPSELFAKKFEAVPKKTAKNKNR